MIIEFLPEAQKQFTKLDKPIQLQIKKYLDTIAKLDDPRSRGKGLTSNLSGLWRYRIMDYRILCRIQEDRLVITVVEVGHRKAVYE